MSECEKSIFNSPQKNKEIVRCHWNHVSYQSKGLDILEVIPCKHLLKKVFLEISQNSQ